MTGPDDYAFAGAWVESEKSENTGWIQKKSIFFRFLLLIR